MLADRDLLLRVNLIHEHSHVHRPTEGEHVHEHGIDHHPATGLEPAPSPSPLGV